MKVLIIGLGQLGNYVLENISKNEDIDVEVFTSGEIKNFNNKNIKSLDKLSKAVQPDILFITANMYKPEDRISYLNEHINSDKIIDFRDDEAVKNKEMILNIVSDLKHLNEVPVIITANPPELLVKLASERLKWNSIYNMQMMLDNKRISKITSISEDEYLCIGEHGRPVPTLSHIKNTEDKEYKDIDLKLSEIKEILLENQGIPNLEESKESLNKLIEAFVNNSELKCILTSYKYGIAFGRPFLMKGLNIQEQHIPNLSVIENTLLNETKERLVKKWGENKETNNEVKIKFI